MLTKAFALQIWTGTALCLLEICCNSWQLLVKLVDSLVHDSHASTGRLRAARSYFRPPNFPVHMTPQDDEKREQLRQQLNDTHTWPYVFKFKFIVPAKPENEAALRAIFGTQAAFKVRESSKGNYRAVTVDETVAGPDDIFARYEAASKIPGIFSL